MCLSQSQEVSGMPGDEWSILPPVIIISADHPLEGWN